MLGITGLGGKTGTLLLAISYGHIFPMLLVGMVLSIVLGMGLPSAAACIIAASVVGPVLTLAGFLVPFMLIYSPALILGGSTLEVTWSCITATMGIVFLGYGLQKYCFGLLNPVQSLLLLVAAVLSIYSGIITDGIGFLCAAIALSFPVQRAALATWFAARRTHSKVTA